ncbi:MAG: chemotaxis protein CheW [Bryobacteraceae bacterium]
MSAPLSAPAAATEGVDRTGKYLTFRLGAEEFGIQVLKVREIMGMQEITAVPQTPGWIKGVINLRGKVIAVIDLRLKFGMPPEPYNQRTCIVVVQFADAGEKMLIGVVVDEVSEVANIAAGEVEDTPGFGAAVPTPYILGLAKQKNKVKILLDIDRVLTNHEVDGVQLAVEAGEAQ